jgi:HlyD family secretion protein
MKGYIIAGIISLVIIGGAGYYWFTLSKAPSYITASVKRGQIIEEVSARGNVASPTTINLQFQNSGKLTFFGVKVGDKVKAGDVIARQDTTVLKAQLRQAQALVDSQNAQLVSLEEGTRQEQIAVTEAQVKSDQIAVSQANQNIIYAIQSAYTVSDDSVHNKVDQIITNPKSTTPALVVTTNNSEAANKVLSERVSTENILTMWKSNVSNLSSSGSNLLTLGVEAQKNLSLISQFLSNVNLVLNGAVPTATESQTSINSWISNVATARTNVDSSVSSLNTAITTLKNNLATLDKDQKNLALEQAGSTKSSITAQEAQVAQAKANVSAIEAQINKWN